MAEPTIASIHADWDRRTVGVAAVLQDVLNFALDYYRRGKADADARTYTPDDVERLARLLERQRVLRSGAFYRYEATEILVSLRFTPAHQAGVNEAPNAQEAEKAHGVVAPRESTEATVSKTDAEAVAGGLTPAAASGSRPCSCGLACCIDALDPNHCVRCGRWIKRRGFPHDGGGERRAAPVEPIPVIPGSQEARDLRVIALLENVIRGLGYIAENQARTSSGFAMAYSEDAFERLVSGEPAKYDPEPKESP